MFALLLAIPATARMVSLYGHLRSEIEELLPRERPSVLAIDELRARMPGLQFFGVVVDAGIARAIAAGDRFIDDLAERIRTYPAEMVRAVRTGRSRVSSSRTTPPSLSTWRTSATIRSRIEARRDYDMARGTGPPLDDDEPPPSLDFSDLKARYEPEARG